MKASEVNGLSTFTMETNPETELMRLLGISESATSAASISAAERLRALQLAAMAASCTVAKALRRRNGRG